MYGDTEMVGGCRVTVAHLALSLCMVIVVAVMGAPLNNLEARSLDTSSQVPLANGTCVNQTCTETCVPSTQHFWGNCCNTTASCQWDKVFQDYRCIPRGLIC
eukprot:m.352904 g.352904  ORF g.352904 m.352904 type:complete len:102 (+) comp16640_c0_seq1:84-389(+)